MKIASILLTLIITGSFCVLEAFAYGRAAPSTPIHTVVQRPTAEQDMSPIGGPVSLRRDTGYSHNDVKRLEVLLQRSEHESRGRKAALVLATVYRVTPENMNADIFGRGK